jgi:hypothetical protein
MTKVISSLIILSFKHQNPLGGLDALSLCVSWHHEVEEEGIHRLKHKVVWQWMSISTHTFSYQVTPLTTSTLMKRNRTCSWMDWMTIFNSSCSTQTIQTSNTWLTRPLLLKTRSRRRRRTARGRCNSMDNPPKATLGLASRSLTSSSNHHRWISRRYQCQCRALSSRYSDWTFKHNARASRCRGLNSKHLDPMHSNHLARTCSKTPTLMLQHRRMHQLK